MRGIPHHTEPEAKTDNNIIIAVIVVVIIMLLLTAASILNYKLRQNPDAPEAPIVNVNLNPFVGNQNPPNNPNANGEDNNP